MSKEFDTSLDVLFGKVDELVSTKTVVGEAIVLGDVTLLPLIEVGVGVVGAEVEALVDAAIVDPVGVLALDEFDGSDAPVE